MDKNIVHITRWTNLRYRRIKLYMPLMRLNVNRSVLICCCLGLFISTLDTGIINLALKPLSVSFGVSLEYMGLAIVLYLFALIVFLIPAGWIGDIYGDKVALLIGFSVFGLTSLTAALSDSAIQLIFSRCGQGAAAALLQANCLGMAGRQTAEEKGKLNSAIMLAISTGPILGPSLAGLLMQWGGWPLLFFINIPLCITGTFFVLQLPANQHKGKQNFDFVGALLFFVTLSLGMLITYRREFTFSNSQALFMLILLPALFVLFCWREIKTDVPFLPVELLKKTPIKYVSIGSLFFGITAGIIFSSSPILFIQQRDFNIEKIGMICTASPLGVIVSVFIKKALTTNARRVISVWALPSMFISFTLLFLYNENISVYKYVVAAIFYGVGGGLLQSSLLKIAMAQHKESQSTIGGMLRLFQNGGIIAGTAISLFMLERGSGVIFSLYQDLWFIVIAFSVAMFFYSFYVFSSQKRKGDI